MEEFLSDSAAMSECPVLEDGPGLGGPGERGSPVWANVVVTV
jgi:hypothetical protein